jgi:monoamine oxidase
MVFIDTFFAENRYICSCYQSNTKPGVFTKLLDMGEPLDAYSRDGNGLIFVDSEYSDEFPSYVEGAIRSARKKVHCELGLVDLLARHIQ